MSNDALEALDKMRRDFGDLMLKIRQLKNLAEKRQDAELQSLALEIGASACRVVNAETLRLYLKEFCSGNVS